MSSELAVEVRGLAKHYRLYDRPHHRLLQMLWMGRRRYFRDFTALQDVNFELERGQTLGIIGHNGAGKSTLLQLICGTLEPTAGQVQVRGRLSALLELGAGFNPEFTGRENMAISAAILGLSPQELAERSDEILAFADIGDHIDQPVKTYSSGMFVRLAFSVAIHVKPDVLVVDEALAVGDAFFQARCMTRMRRMLDDGLTLLFTSHDVAAVKSLCRQALWLDHGRVRAYGPTGAVTQAYSADWVARANLVNQAPADRAAHAASEPASADEKATAAQAADAPTGVAVVRAGWRHQGEVVTRLVASHGQALTVHLELQVLKPCRHLVVSFHIKNAQGQHVLGGHTAEQPGLYDRTLQPGERFTLGLTVPMMLHHGNYSLTVLAASIADVQQYSDAIFHLWLDDVAVLEVPRREHFPVSDQVELPVQVELSRS